MHFRLLLLSLCLLGPTIISGTPLSLNKIIANITISGNHHILQKELPSKTTLKSKVGTKTNQKDILSDIQTLYLSGFFHQVEAITTPKKEHITLTFLVQENPIIKTISFKGNTLFSDKQLQKHLNNKPGQVFNVALLEKDKKIIEAYYQEKGYDLFQITQITLEDNILIINVTEGQIETITLSGLKKLDPINLKKALRLQKGKPFNSKQLRKDHEQLLKSGYFNNVSYPKLLESKDRQSVQIHYQLSEKKANRIDIGLEQEEEQFALFIQSIKNHNLIQTDLFSGKLQLAKDKENIKIKSYSVRYNQPWLLNKYPVSLTLDIYNKFNQEVIPNQSGIQFNNTEETLRRGGTLALGHPIIRDKLTFYTKYKKEKVNSKKSNSQINPYTLHSLSLSLVYNSTNSIYNPKKGSYWNIEYEKGGDLNILDLAGIDYSRTQIDTATFIKTSKKSTVGLHAKLGFFKPNKEEKITYETESFVIGGSTTLRGYKETDYPFSGTRKILINTEYRYDLSKKIQCVIFYDLGKTFDTGWNFTENYHSGKGLGLRFFTPVGPIRTDLAIAKKEYIIHFGLGQLF